MTSTSLIKSKNLLFEDCLHCWLAVLYLLDLLDLILLGPEISLNVLVLAMQHRLWFSVLDNNLSLEYNYFSIEQVVSCVANVIN